MAVFQLSFLEWSELKPDLKFVQFLQSRVKNVLEHEANVWS